VKLTNRLKRVDAAIEEELERLGIEDEDEDEDEDE